MFNRILKFNKSTEMKKSHLAALLFASLLPLACSDYVGDYEDEWKDPYGNEEAFKEMLNKFDWPWSPTCNTDDWIWCTVQKGEFMSQTEDGESWSQFTEGSVSLSFAGKDDKAYNFTTDLLPDDPTPILRRNGGLAVKLDKASGDFEAGVQVKSDNIAKYSKIVVGYGNEYSEAYVSLRSVNKEGEVKGEWRRKLNVGSFEVLTVKYEDMEYVSGEKNIYSFIKNDANTIAFVVNKKASVDKGLTIVAIGFDGSALTEPKSSAKSTTTKSSSSVKSTTAKSSSSVKSTTAKSSSSVKSTTAKSSSSTKSTAASSSSVKSTTTSSSSVVMQFIWNGKDKSNVIRTGFGSGSPWEALLDTVKNGTTSMFVPKEGVYETCNGLCGFVKFGSKDAWAQESFKLQPSQEKNIAVDVSAMKGLCVTYSTNKDAALYLDSKDKNSPTIGAAKVTLPKVGDTDKYYVKNFEWSEFEQGSWKLSGEDAVKSLSSIAIIFESSAGGSQFFNIYQIGSYGMCGDDKDISPTDIDASYFYNTAFTYSWDYMNPSIDYGEFVDPRDNRIYKTVKIGNQTWMAQNLDFVVDDSYCYNDTGSYCNKYGSLYTWAAAMDSVGKYTNTSKGCGNGKSCETFETVVGLCPTGWHMPSHAEWDILLSTAGDTDKATKSLITTIGWDAQDGSDSYGFSALPAGYRTSGADFDGIGTLADFWSSTADGDEGTYIVSLVPGQRPKLGANFDRNNAFSVRCVKTEPLPTDISDEDLIWYGGTRLINDSATTCLKNKLLKENVWMNADKYITFGASAYSPQLLASCKGGICGKAGKIPEDAYPGFGFMVNTDSTFEKWGGVCVTYTASKDSIMMYLGTGGGADSAYSHSIKWNFYHVYLPMAEEPTTRCYALPEFAQADWGPQVKFDLYLPQVREVSFQLKSNVSNSTFNIIAVGSYKAGYTAYDEFMQDEANRTKAKDFLNPDIEYGELIDPRDGQVYKTIQFDFQTWMAQNLNYEKDGSECYDSKQAKCDMYGRLYTWDAAQDACPDGWRLPEMKDFHNLFNETYNGANDAKMYKSKTGWTSDYNGTDNFGFTVLPAGFKNESGEYKFETLGAQFQTSSVDNLNGPCYASIHANKKPYGGLCGKNVDKTMRSVRCVKEYNPLEYLNPNITYGEFTDKRDDKVYKTIEIGNQTWLAQNLNYNKERWCYNGDSALCDLFGGLYSWSAAKEACPENWHLPTKAEFETLIKYISGDEGYAAAVKKLKAISGWTKNNNGTNDYGFSAIGAGYRSPDNKETATMAATLVTDFWSITEKNEDDAYLLTLDNNPDIQSILIAQTKQFGFSVRCVSGDNIPNTSATDFLNTKKTYDEFTDTRDNQVYKTIKIGHQEWMAQNLNYETTSSACYDDKDYNCNTYGRLYKWTDAQNVCPEGWHLPKWEEYQTLVEAVGGKETAGKKLKAANDWVEDYNTGDNESGFTILPAGYKETHEYKWLNFGAFFQTSSVNDVNGPCYAEIFENGNFESGLCSKTDEMRSVRCVKNFEIQESSSSTTSSSSKVKESSSSTTSSSSKAKESSSSTVSSSSKEKESSSSTASSSSEVKNSSSSVTSSSSVSTITNKSAWDFLNPNIKYGQFMDSRDAQIYKTIEIEDQMWMAQNLNYESTESICYAGEPANCTAYGKLYSWEESQSICPPGWILPKAKDYDKVISAAGGIDAAGQVLKAQTGWSEGYNGNDEFGFSILAAGNGSINDNHFISSGAFFNTSTEDDTYGPCLAYVKNNGPFYGGSCAQSSRQSYNSVRCIMDYTVKINENVTTSQLNPKITYGEYTDQRDGQIYKTVKINNQTWMAQNLNVGKWILSTKNQTNNGTIEKYCYDNYNLYCERYGGLYQWTEAMMLPDDCLESDCQESIQEKHKGICPDGWHLPSYADFQSLVNFVGGDEGTTEAGKVLKALGNWKSATDDYGFSAIGAGKISQGEFDYISNMAVFWTATNASASNTSQSFVVTNYDDRAISSGLDKSNGYSVRCIMD